MKTILALAFLMSAAIITGCVTNNYDNEHSGSMKGDGHASDPPMGDTKGMGGMHSMEPVTSEYVFVREMIPHHQEAVDTSRIVIRSTLNPELKALAESIITAQEREITMMQSWLADWYPNQSTTSSYKPMMGDMYAVTGEERDIAFLRGMVMHHEMAVMMATDVLALEHRGETKSLALGIIESQTAEIRQMTTILTEDYDATVCGANCPMTSDSGSHMMPDGSMMHGGMN